LEHVYRKYNKRFIRIDDRKTKRKKNTNLSRIYYEYNWRKLNRVESGVLAVLKKAQQEMQAN
jgi:hypothetical protein